AGDACRDSDQGPRTVDVRIESGGGVPAELRLGEGVEGDSGGFGDEEGSTPAPTHGGPRGPPAAAARRAPPARGSRACGGRPAPGGRRPRGGRRGGRVPRGRRGGGCGGRACCSWGGGCCRGGISPRRIQTLPARRTRRCPSQ